MATRRKRRRRDARLLEGALLVGAAAGLLLPVRTGAARACHAGAARCLTQSLAGAASPYVMHALTGAAAALALAAAGVAAWRLRQRPRREPEASRAIPERVRHEVWRRDQGRCVDCGSRARLEFDHIIPFARGGSSTARNIELRCEPCNRRKGARI